MNFIAIIPPKEVPKITKPIQRIALFVSGFICFLADLVISPNGTFNL